MTTTGRQRLCDVIPGGRHTVLLGNGRNIETIEGPFDLFFDKNIYSLIETETNEKIRTKTEALTKHKELLLESSKYLNYVHWLTCFVIMVSME